MAKCILLTYKHIIMFKILEFALKITLSNRKRQPFDRTWSFSYIEPYNPVIYFVCMTFLWSWALCLVYGCVCACVWSGHRERRAVERSWSWRWLTSVQMCWSCCWSSSTPARWSSTRPTPKPCWRLPTSFSSTPSAKSACLS